MKALRFVGPFLILSFAVSMMTTATAQPKSAAHVLQSAVISGSQTSSFQRSGSALPLDQNDPFFFLQITPYSWGGYMSLSVAVADVNGDGKPDIVVVGETNDASIGGTVGVFLGNGDGTFQPAVNYSTGGYGPRSVAIADVNGDGKPDLVVTNTAATLRHQNGSFVGVLLGNGDGTFQPAVTLAPTLYGAGAAAVADVNGDGKPDLVVGGSDGSGFVTVYLGNGNGTFQPPVPYGSGGSDVSSIAIADVNGDGKPDVVAVNLNNCTGCGNSSIGVLLGNGNGTFQPAVTYSPGGEGTNSLSVADVNGDGKLDLVVANEAASSGAAGSVGVLLGNGDGTFQPAVTYNSGGYGADSVAVADVNGDGNLDVVVSNTSQAWSENSPVGSMGILLGNGDGTFQPPINYGIYDTEQIYQGGSCSVALADLNGDGKPDIVVESSQNTTNATFFFAYVGVLLNNYGAPSTTTSLASNVNPVGLTQSVTYTATVNQSGQSVAGSVVFSDAGVPIGQATLANNQAAFTTRYSSSKLVGPHAITATYSGALQSAESSQSAALTQYVGNTATKTTVATSGSPSVVGQSVTFTATTTAAKYGPVLDGETVSFYSGTTLLGTATTTSGVATFTTSFPAAKTYSIKATFQGNGFFKASSGTVKQVVSKTAPAAPGPPADESAKSSPDPLDANAPCGTSIALITSGSPSLFSNDVTFTAQVNENQYCRNSHILSCQGIVDFYDGKTLIGSPVVTGSCIVEADTQNLTVKSHYIKAIYEPGDGWHSNSAHLTQVVQKWPTSTALTSSANPSTYRQDVTFTAIVTSTQQGPTTPSGQVRFLNGTKALGAATLDENGMATFTTKILPVGTNSITAIYRGDSINASDTSAPLSQTVNQAPAKQ